MDAPKGISKTSRDSKKVKWGIIFRFMSATEIKNFVTY